MIFINDILLSNPDYRELFRACDHRTSRTADYHTADVTDDVIQIMRITDDIVIDMAATIKDVVAASGESQSAFTQSVHWDKTQCAKCLKENSTRGVPFEVMLGLADKFGVSLSRLLFAEDLHPTPLRKHALLLHTAREWDEDKCNQVAEDIRSSMTNAYQIADWRNPTNEMVRDLICNRFRDVAADRGITAHYLAPDALRSKLRSTLDQLDVGAFVGRIQSFVVLCLSGGISPDFLLRYDYSDLVRFYTFAGNLVPLRPCDRNLLRAVLRCSDREEENEIIGRMLA